MHAYILYTRRQTNKQTNEAHIRPIMLNKLARGYDVMRSCSMGESCCTSFISIDVLRLLFSIEEEKNNNVESTQHGYIIRFY